MRHPENLAFGHIAAAKAQALRGERRVTHLGLVRSQPESFAQANHLIEHALRDFPLGGLGNFNHFVLGDDGDSVAIGVEADAFARDIIHHDGIERLCDQLLARVLQDVFGFSGESQR